MQNPKEGMANSSSSKADNPPDSLCSTGSNDLSRTILKHKTFPYPKDLILRSCKHVKAIKVLGNFIGFITYCKIQGVFNDIAKLPAKFGKKEEYGNGWRHFYTILENKIYNKLYSQFSLFMREGLLKTHNLRYLIGYYHALYVGFDDYFLHLQGASSDQFEALRMQLLTTCSERLNIEFLFKPCFRIVCGLLGVEKLAANLFDNPLYQEGEQQGLLLGRYIDQVVNYLARTHSNVYARAMLIHEHDRNLLIATSLATQAALSDTRKPENLTEVKANSSDSPRAISDLSPEEYQMIEIGLEREDIPIFVNGQRTTFFKLSSLRKQIDTDWQEIMNFKP